MRTNIRLEHVISFSDAIFAFSITFMAISIQLPNLPENLTQEQVIRSLAEDLGPLFAIYGISFFVIAAYWTSYHQIFNHIVGSHGVILWLNLLFLFIITMIPFAVNLQVDYGFYQIIFILYASILTAAGSILTLIWFYAKRNKLLEQSLRATEIKNYFLEIVLVPSVFALSILVSVVDLKAAYFFWIAIIPAKILIRKRSKKQK
jgi:TMEM175 potassium channel family protein